ncbi:hypothetical protein GCM10028798_20130 [Humibacter antri]
MSDNEFIALSRLEADLLGVLAERLTSLATGAATRERMFPDAYHDDAEAAEFHALTDVDLVTAKSEAARNVMDAFMAAEQESSGSRWKHARTRTVSADHELSIALLRNLTDLRLMVADRLGIHDDDDGTGGAAADRVVYWWLGETQELLVEALAAGAFDREHG